MKTDTQLALTEALDEFKETVTRLNHKEDCYDYMEDFFSDMKSYIADQLSYIVETHIEEHKLPA